MTWSDEAIATVDTLPYVVVEIDPITCDAVALVGREPDLEEATVVAQQMQRPDAVVILRWNPDERVFQSVMDRVLVCRICGKCPNERPTEEAI